MATIKFPLTSEYEHPQYKWNEQEFILRMLYQNRIAISLSENNSQVTVSFDPALSLNFVAKGAVDFKKYNTNRTATFNTNKSFWIYLREDGSGFYEETFVKPDYNQYIHGWYRSNGDRAVVFVDPEQQAGYRAMLMDSFNCHYQYEQRIPDTGGDVIWEIYNYSDLIPSFSGLIIPGSYRFHLKGGKGGNGGWQRNNSNQNVPDNGTGGKGSEGQLIIWKLNIYNQTKFTGFRGGEGEQGKFTEGVAWLEEGYGFLGLEGRSWSLQTGAGGGSSGSNSRLLSEDTILIDALGGAGGGGAAPNAIVNYDYLSCTDAGGGGAGYTANSDSERRGANGFAMKNPNHTTGAYGGSLKIGGQKGWGARRMSNIAYIDTDIFDHNEDIRNGQNLNKDGVNRLRRRGGDSIGLTGKGHSVGKAYGGNSLVGMGGSEFKVYRTKVF
jgi:hypothetical protein